MAICSTFILSWTVLSPLHLAHFVHSYSFNLSSVAGLLALQPQLAFLVFFVTCRASFYLCLLSYTVLLTPSLPLAAVLLPVSLVNCMTSRLNTAVYDLCDFAVGILKFPIPGTFEGGALILSEALVSSLTNQQTFQWDTLQKTQSILLYYYFCSPHDLMGSIRWGIYCDGKMSHVIHKKIH